MCRKKIKYIVQSRVVVVSKRNLAGPWPLPLASPSPVAPFSSCLSTLSRHRTPGRQERPCRPPGTPCVTSPPGPSLRLALTPCLVFSLCACVCVRVVSVSVCVCVCVCVCCVLQANKAKDLRGEVVEEEHEPEFVDYPLPELKAPDGSVIGTGEEEDAAGEEEVDGAAEALVPVQVPAGKR